MFYFVNKFVLQDDFGDGAKNHLKVKKCLKINILGKIF